MSPCGKLCHVALVRTDFLEELTRATQHNIPEDAIVQIGYFVISDVPCSRVGWGAYKQGCLYDLLLKPPPPPQKKIPQTPWPLVCK
jgi:hypothetical protein